MKTVVRYARRLLGRRRRKRTMLFRITFQPALAVRSLYAQYRKPPHHQECEICGRISLAQTRARRVGKSNRTSPRAPDNAALGIGPIVVALDIDERDIAERKLTTQGFAGRTVNLQFTVLRMILRYAET